MVLTVFTWSWRMYSVGFLMKKKDFSITYSNPDVKFNKLVAASRTVVTGNKKKTADSRQQTADSRQQTADSRQQTTDSRQHLPSLALHEQRIEVSWLLERKLPGTIICFFFVNALKMVDTTSCIGPEKNEGTLGHLGELRAN
jgi:hypothetical protein